MLRHASLLVDLSDWSDEKRKDNAQLAILELREFLVNRGYLSLETEIGKIVRGFTGYEADVRIVTTEEDSFAKRLASKISVYTTCLKKDDSLLFLDLEQRKKILYAEFDIFTPAESSVDAIKADLIENTMKCFGLTKAKDALVSSQPSTPPIPRIIAERLTPKEPLSDALFQRLKEETERGILRELRKRGSILEADLKDLSTSEISLDRVKKTLDYLSGDEYKLVERKFAIVCRDTQEIIFLLKSKGDIENASNLECPKCSRKIGLEHVAHYYSSTDSLKLLMDGNRWMPLLIRDSLLRAGVPKDNILTEAKHGEDELDLLVFYKGRLFVIEAKNRPVSLNDAYKLSAKTSRIESVASKSRDDVEGAFLDVGGRFSIDQPMFENLRRGRVVKAVDFVPVVIATHDVAKDAKDLLVETKSMAKVLENCESQLDSFVATLISQIDREDLESKIGHLISQSTSDSPPNLAAFQVQQAIAKWYEVNSDTREVSVAKSQSAV